MSEFLESSSRDFCFSWSQATRPSCYVPSTCETGQPGASGIQWMVKLTRRLGDHLCRLGSKCCLKDMWLTKNMILFSQIPWNTLEFAPLTTLWNYFYPSERVILWFHGKREASLCAIGLHFPQLQLRQSLVFFLLHYCSYVEAETEKCKIQSKIRYDTAPFPDRWKSFNSWSISR